MPLAAGPSAAPHCGAVRSAPAGDVAGKVALVTGAARGLGRAMATALADRGATVLVNDLLPGPAEEAAHAIRERGGTADGLPFDVSVSAASHRAVDALVDRYGRLDILLNNPGSGDFGE